MNQISPDNVGKVADQVRDLKETASERVRALAESGRARADEATSSAFDRAAALFQDHPFAVTAAAAAAGAIVGIYLPRWGGVLKVGSAAGNAVSKAAKAIAAAETVKTIVSATSAAGSAVREGAHNAAGAVRAGAQDAASTVRSSAHAAAAYVPDTDALRDGARDAITKASDAAKSAGSSLAKSAKTARKNFGID